VTDDRGYRTRALTILGATGSIGISTLQVAEHLGIPIYALTAHSKVEQLAAQAKACRAAVAVVADPSCYAEL
jgi:1-deoxy-D-xylulose-5-phosphate reductoisomerase